MFNSVSALLKDEYISDISFRKTTKYQCVLSTEKGNDTVAIIKTPKQSYYLLESNELINDRYDFDEDGLVENAKVLDKKISMILNNNFSYIENVVALTKKLNNALDKPSSGKWLFGQYKSEHDLINFDGLIEIESNKRITSRFSENLIYLNGVLKAKIMFIVGEA
ncbi:hypothetical protein [Vibrio sp. TRT 17S01]|uniref:hypothetical protein n=1 Tax=Vibrio sp. TRT 17S01 TaxID=3418505 RepID=UPI003CF96ECC